MVWSFAIYNQLRRSRYNVSVRRLAQLARDLQTCLDSSKWVQRNDSKSLPFVSSEFRYQRRYRLIFEFTQFALNKPWICKEKIVNIIKSLPFLFLPDQTVWQSRAERSSVPALQWYLIFYASTHIALGLHLEGLLWNSRKTITKNLFWFIRMEGIFLILEKHRVCVTVLFAGLDVKAVNSE